MIVATAGHVDHGKTSLIQQLTGVDTDRLEEEKRRGLSINLGFAYRKVDAHASIGFIDVPGHKNFINTMISGISGIDIGMLIVAADDGVMPQTLEHLQVMDLLGVKNIVVVISKIDCADQARVEFVRHSVVELLPESQIFEISNRLVEDGDGNSGAMGHGVKQLQGFLDGRARTLKHRAEHSNVNSELFRLSIDRAFTLKGSGLVVTGTVTSGSVKAGDTVRLQSASSGSTFKVRVRSIHAQNEMSQVGCAGQRCAFNLVGDFDRQSVRRGDYLSDVACIEPGFRFDARVEICAGLLFALKHMLSIKIYVGARRVAAKLFILRQAQRTTDPGCRKLLAADFAMVQIILQESLLLCRGDRFLIRDDSESINLGGGTVLIPQAPPWRKDQGRRLQHLSAMEERGALPALLKIINEHQQPQDYLAFKLAWNMTEDQSEAILLDQDLTQSAQLLVLEGRQYLVPRRGLEKTSLLLCQHLETFHCERPMEEGAVVADLAKKFNAGDDILFRAALTILLKEQSVLKINGLLSRAGHRPSVSSQVQQSWLQFSNLLRKGGFQVPLISEIEKESGLNANQLSALIKPALKRGEIVQLNRRRYMLSETRNAIENQLADLASQRDVFTVIDVKKQLGLGRNLTIEILEYLDSVNVTRRKNEGRELLL